MLNKAAGSNEPARVNNIGNSDGMVKLDDYMVDITAPVGLTNAIFGFTATITNLLTSKYAKLYPNVAFINTYPGFVATDLGNTLPWYVRYIMKPFAIFAQSVEESGVRMHFVNYVCDKFDKGAFLVDNHGELLDEKFEQLGYLGEDDIQRVHNSLLESWKFVDNNNQII